MKLITPEAAKRCEEQLTPEQLRAVREEDERMAARRLAQLRKRMNGNGDMDDVNLAFLADVTHSHKKGFD